MNFDELMTENMVLRQKLARREQKSCSDKRHRRTIGVRVPRELYDQCAKAARSTHRTMYRFTLDAVITELYRCPRHDRTPRDGDGSHATRTDPAPDPAPDPASDRGDLRRSAAICGDPPPWDPHPTSGR